MVELRASGGKLSLRETGTPLLHRFRPPRPQLPIFCRRIPVRIAGKLVCRSTPVGHDSRLSGSDGDAAESPCECELLAMPRQRDAAAFERNRKPLCGPDVFV